MPTRQPENRQPENRQPANISDAAIPPEIRQLVGVDTLDFRTGVKNIYVAGIELETFVKGVV